MKEIFLKMKHAFFIGLLFLLKKQILAQKTYVFTPDSPCPAGTISDNGRGVIGQCISCPYGKYQSLLGQNQCLNCPFGKKSSPDFKKCLDCDESENSCPLPYNITINKIVKNGNCNEYELSSYRGLFNGVRYLDSYDDCAISKNSSVDGIKYDSMGQRLNGIFYISFCGAGEDFQLNDQMLISCTQYCKLFPPVNAIGQGCFSSYIPKDKAVCFPLSAQVLVTLANGSAKNVPISSLKIGDEVFSYGNILSPIYFFSHREFHANSLFVKIDTNLSSILISPSHLIYINGRFIPARHARFGDMVSNINGTLFPITNITMQWAKGLFNPHSFSGELIVDGFRVSSYTGAIQQELAHSLLAPLRAMYNLGFNYTIWTSYLP